jgi:glycosyltransferase involved in cell wall biosynthesis
LFVHRLISFTPVLLSHARLPRTFFDLDDIEHISFRRSIKQPPWYPEKLLLYLRLPMVMFWEQRAVRLSHKTFVCSENDRNYLSKIFCSKKIAVIPNAIDVHDAVEPSDKPRLLFLGQMSYYPNRMAADYLINSIWPAVFSALPDARLLIAGSGHESLAGFASSPPGVEFLGFVDDLETLYKKATVVCCPILYGGGTRIKILEAAAYGRPVVSTTVGAEGIDLRAEEEILLRDTPGSFAEACIRLLKDRNLTVQIGQAARSAVSEKYGRNNAVNAIRSYLGGPGLSA